MSNAPVSEVKLRRQIRNLILFVMFAIFMSGITAFPLESELRFLEQHLSWFPEFLHEWIHLLSAGIQQVNEHFSFISYGTDWLAFAHVMIALVFIGPLRDPVKNKWVIDWGILCCFAVLPLALIAGPIRNIPFFHRLIDCSFGIIGFFPLWIIRKKIQQLESMILH